MQTQNYNNHRQYVPGYHFITFFLLLLNVGLTVFCLIKVWYPHDSFWRGGVFPVLTSNILLILFFYIRIFPKKVQDRTIRAEETLRYYIMTGKPIDPRLTLKQLIALRFAGDDEFVELCKTAAEKSLSPDEIKKSIKNWRPDNDRC